MNAADGRLKRFARRMRQHPWRSAFLVLAGCFVFVNLLVYRHARAMLTFDATGGRTPRPQSLTAWQKIKVLASGVSIPRPQNTCTPRDLDLAVETVQFSSRDGTRLEGWLLTPQAPKGTVLLFHGYAASRSTLLEEARAFYEMGYVAMLVDFRGSGGSDGNTTSLGYYEAEDVTAAMHYARRHDLPRPLVLYGQSMGGAAVLRSIAASGEQPDAVILEAVFGRMLQAVRNRFGMMGVPSFPGAELLVFWGGVQIGFSGFQHNPEEYARVCDCPALVLHGDADRHARLEEGQSVCANLKGPKELVVFEGAEHTSLHRFAPARWKAAVGAFLREIVPHPDPDKGTQK